MRLDCQQLVHVPCPAVDNLVFKDLMGMSSNRKGKKKMKKKRAKKYCDDAVLSQLNNIQELLSLQSPLT